MGGVSVANVHIHTGNRSPQAVHDDVVRAIHTYMLAEGFVETTDTGSDDELPADRVFVVSPAVEPWITIYDEAFRENMLDTRTLMATARMVSTATASTALAVMLFQSRVFDMYLYRKGRTVDMFSNDPGYLRSVTEKQRAKYVGREDRWRGLLANPATPASLRRIWDMEDAEEMLEEIIPLLQLSDRYGFADLDDSIEGFTLLAFHMPRTPVYAIKAQGPPVFDWAGVSGFWQSVGEDVSEHNPGMASVYNTGGASQGLQILITGDALEGDLFQPHSVSVFTHNEPLSDEHPLDHTTIGHSKAYTVTLPAFNIPVGLAEPFSSGQAEPGQLHKAMDAEAATQVTVLIRGSAQSAGTGELSITLIPLANPEHGRCTLDLPVMIKEPGDDWGSLIQIPQ